MKSRITFLIISCLVLLVFTSVTASAKEITVDDDSGADFRSIQEAVDNSTPGDTIIIRSGSYTEDVHVDVTGLIIRAESNSSDVQIKPMNEYKIGFWLEADNITISGLNIEGRFIIDSDMNKVTGNTIENGYIELGSESKGNLIAENKVLNGGGIHISCCGFGTNKVLNNTISNCHIGIYEYDQDADIRNNTITDCDYGIELVVTGSGIDNNIISNCDVGILISDAFFGSITNNKIISCSECGILDQGNYGGLTYNNYLNNSINVIGSDGTVGGWNNALTRGTNIVGGPYIGGNFWAKPDGTGLSQTCVDVDGNGIGDLPYKIYESYYDYLPLVSVNLDLPLADFNANTSSGDVPLSVQFTDNSEKVTEWNWNFGDGTFSKEQNPVHVYTTPGTYNIVLNASNANGTKTKSSTITVLKPAEILPIANFSVNATVGIAPLSVQFTDASQYATRWSWDFDSNGIVDSTEKGPVHIYSTAGTYTAQLTASNENGTDSETVTISVIAVGTENETSNLPVAVLGANVTSGYIPFCVQFTDLSQNIVSRSWDIGNDGTVDSTDASFIYEFSSKGTYPVKLTVTNASGSSSEIITISALRKSSSSGGSSSGGGGAGGSPEPTKNVKSKELCQVFITSGKAVKFDFTKNATSIVALNFDSKKTVGKTTTIVEMLKNKSTLTPEAPEGEVYNYLNIWVGNGGYGNDEDNLENAAINFKVEKAWVEDKGIDKSSITINRYNDKKWNALPTTFLSEDDKYLYFKAETPGFSPFAITGEATEKQTNVKIQPETEDKKEGDRCTAGNVEQQSETKENTSIPEKTTSTPGFEIAYCIACLFAIFLYRR